MMYLRCCWFIWDI